MRISIIAFTERGGRLCTTIAEKLNLAGEMTLAYGLGSAGQCDLIPCSGGLSKWTKEAFESSDALVFVGATGIAVRAIAPYIKSKDVDPAVITVDEMGHFVISLLSGHIGGANELAKLIAEKIGAQPVVSTATDLNSAFAVDVWAVKNMLTIDSLKAAKQVSADVLNHRNIYLYSEYNLGGQIPENIQQVDAITLKEKINQGDTCIVISEKKLSSLKGHEKTLLQLIPKSIYVGMGCRKDTGFKPVNDLYSKALDICGIRPEAVCSINSIDLKAQEKALIKLSEKNGVPFRTYSGEELMALEGEFTTSDFVKNITGVDNVCERSAVLAAGEGATLVLDKTSTGGVTIALARKKVEINF